MSTLEERYNDFLAALAQEEDEAYLRFMARAEEDELARIEEGEEAFFREQVGLEEERSAEEVYP